MVVDREQVVKLLNLGMNDRVLEILSSDGKDIGSFGGMVREMETVEDDPEKAYSGNRRVINVKAENHFIFCGNPYIFLKKKIEDHAEFDAVIVHVDRLEYPRKMWNLIEQLNPLWVILTYKMPGNGKYNKRLMEAYGFEIIWQENDLPNSIEERVCIGRNKKCYFE